MESCSSHSSIEIEERTENPSSMSPIKSRHMLSPRISGEEFDFVEGYYNFMANEFTDGKQKMDKYLEQQERSGRPSFQKKTKKKSSNLLPNFGGI
jgi:hypothetical protein